MSEFDEARKLAIRCLEKALIAHENDDVFSIEDGLEEYELLMHREEIKANSLLCLALEFWSGWSDSAVHDWNFYEPLSKEDWPRLAKILLSDLKANREVTNKEIISNFNVTSKQKAGSILSRILTVTHGK